MVDPIHEPFQWKGSYENTHPNMWCWGKMKWWCFRPLLCTLFRLNWAKQTPGIMRRNCDVGVDACNKASGITFRGDWVYVNYTIDDLKMCSLHINHKEVVSVLYAARRWGHMWATLDVISYTDSTSACGVINKGSTRNEIIMDVLR